MIEKLIAAAVLSLGCSALGKYLPKKKPMEFDVTEVASKHLRKLKDREAILRTLQKYHITVLTSLAEAEGMTATWCKCRTELESFLADRYSTKG